MTTWPQSWNSLMHFQDLRDRALGPDKITYSDIKNLSVDNKSELFVLYRESFSTGQVLEDRSHRYLKPIPKPGNYCIKLNRYRVFTMPGRSLRTSPKPTRVQGRKTYLGNCSQIHIRCLRRIQEEGTNSGRGGRCGKCMQQSAVQTADGTPCALWRQFDAHKMANSSIPEIRIPCHLENRSLRHNI